MRARILVLVLVAFTFGAALTISGCKAKRSGYYPAGKINR